jgi:hypothetical protein
MEYFLPGKKIMIGTIMMRTIRFRKNPSVSAPALYLFDRKSGMSKVYTILLSSKYNSILKGVILTNFQCHGCEDDNISLLSKNNEIISSPWKSAETTKPLNSTRNKIQF